LPELRPIVRRIAYVTWNAVGNGGYKMPANGSIKNSAHILKREL
jgi:hypothetical protein